MLDQGLFPHSIPPAELWQRQGRTLALLALALALPLAAQAQTPATVAVAFDARTIRPVLAEGLADRIAPKAIGQDAPFKKMGWGRLASPHFVVDQPTI